jgi:serine/threonine-protein kinase
MQQGQNLRDVRGLRTLAKMAGAASRRLRGVWSLLAGRLDPERPLRPWQRRLRAVVRLAFAAFILAAAAFLSFILTIQIAIKGREVEVPRLAEMTAEDAKKLLEQRQLGLRVLDQVYSELPRGRIVRQSPPPGTVVKAGQRVHVVVSLGPQEVATPLLEGKSLRAARLELPKLGLQVGQVSACYLPGYEADRVVKQDPPPQSKHAGSPRVNLLVSLGSPEAAYVMPELTGLPLAQAQRRLAAAGLRIGKVEVVTAEDVPYGVVIRQSPRRGARVPAGAIVDLQVSGVPARPRVLEWPAE